MTISRALAHHVISNRTLTPEIHEWMLHLLLDYLAVTAGGTDRQSAEAARASVHTSRQPDHTRIAAIHGIEGWAAPEDAALVNGITAHGLELDDTHEQGSLHPAVVVFPAVLAVADTGGHTTQEVLLASALGYDIMCSVGVLLGAKESYGRGFHPTGVAGALGSAAAVSSLLRLTEEQTTHALGLAANMAAGSLEFLSDGSWTKRLNAGHAAATGIRAARLAAAGFTAPDRSLEGRDGFLRQYGQGSTSGRTLDLEFGKGSLETSIKYYPCCRYMHGNIDLLRELHKELPGLSADDVDSIDVAVINAGAALVSEPAARKLQVDSPVDAQFNMPFGAALALSSGTATVEQFDDARRIARELMPWLELVTCYESASLEAAYPARWEAEVRVVLKDGRVLARRTEAFRGSPHSRANRSDLELKASELLGAEAASALAESVFTLDADAPITPQLRIPTPSLA